MTLLLLLACRDAGPEKPLDDSAATCDPTAPTVDVPALVADDGHTRVVIAPSAVDPATDRYPQADHVVHLPAEITRDELVLFLPGTATFPSAYDQIAGAAVAAGYPVLVLAYDAELNQAEICADVGADEIAACRLGVVREKIHGTDETTYIAIDEPNSIVGRTTRLLEAVHAQAPEAGADRFLDGDAPRWSSMIVAGFSQGSVLAGYLSKEEAFARAVFFAGGCDGLNADDGALYLADWCSEARATPADVTWALSHVRDDWEKDTAIHAAYGLDAFGDYADAGTESPGYCADTHLFAFDLPDVNGGDQAHLAVAHDDYLPVDDDGLAVLAEDYWWLFTAE